MKIFLKTRLLTLLLIAIIPITTLAKNAVLSTTPTTESNEAKVLTNRLLEIEKIDKSTLTKLERKALRKEVKSIKTNLADLNGGVYLTTSAIIIIILLLILIL